MTEIGGMVTIMIKESTNTLMDASTKGSGKMAECMVMERKVPLGREKTLTIQYSWATTGG